MVYDGFNWDQGRWNSLNQIVHDASQEMRLIRPLLKLYGRRVTMWGTLQVIS